VALVRRALKVLTDREVTPQLGLLKSTLLQLDSSFSERDYGSSSFRDFADKLAAAGVVTLRHQGRSTLVDLVEGDGGALEGAHDGALEGAHEGAHGGANGGALEGAHGGALEGAAEGAAEGARPGAFDATPADGTTVAETPYEAGLRQGREALMGDAAPGAAGASSAPGAPRRDDNSASLGEGVAFVRRVLAEAVTAPRWPMYPRQFKQFLRAADPTFDERKYGSIAELMRACQKDGLLKLERDRQGGLRVFGPAGGAPRASVPLGWSVLAGGQPQPGEETGEGPERSEGQPAFHSPDELPDDIGNRIVGGAVDVTRELVGGVGGGRLPLPDIDDDEEDDTPQPLTNESPALLPPVKPRRTRKAPAAAARKTAAKRPVARTPAARPAAARPAPRRKKT
jgi:hypothetical protein